MGNVVEMFQEDEITGMKIPNLSIKPEFICINEQGKGEAIFYTRNEAVRFMQNVLDCKGWIEEIR